MRPARVNDALSCQENWQGKNGSEGTVCEGREAQQPIDGVKVRRGVYDHFFLPECHRREENEYFYGDGHRDEVC
jgi:hypothetical protein